MREKKGSRNFILKLAGLGALLLFTIAGAASVGSADLSIGDSLRILLSRFPLVGNYLDTQNTAPVYQVIVWNVRMPRILLAGLAGCGLAVVGACFQGVFRNPLADPHILGISSGAAAGATIAMLTGIRLSFLGLSFVGIFAFLGALITIIVVYQLAHMSGQVPVVNLLLTGTAVSSLLSAVISLLMTLNRDQIETVYMWTLGSFSAATWDKAGFLAVFIFGGCFLLFLLSGQLNIMSVGEDTAKSLGVDTVFVKKLLLAAASLMVAACVSVSGIVGFVGLIIPHCVRMLAGVRHERLLPCAAIGGAVFMIVCDTLSRTLTAPSELPVGVVTAVFGAPYFIFLLQKNKKKNLL